MKFGTKMNGKIYHIPVLLKEALEALNVQPGEKYVDCTLGGGGHTDGILKAGGIVLGIDQDEEAIKHNQQLAVSSKRLVLRHGNFAHLKEIADMSGSDPVSGVLFDLGVSSHQLETDYRGFSFNQTGPLDMRMDSAGQTVTAADLVNAAGEKELANLFWKYGEEREARKIAREVVKQRGRNKIETTDELAKIILSVSRRGRNDRTHPATRVFQALRIAVNNELENLEQGLTQAVELLKPKGRLVVISFHSLEDRVVKDFMRMNANRLRIITNKPVKPTLTEIERNPRARSGKLRAGEKI